jgi:hypothetical protein
MAEVEQLFEQISEIRHTHYGSQEKLDARILPLLDEILWWQRCIIREIEAELREQGAEQGSRLGPDRLRYRPYR